jgi:hypothetical protein
LCVRAGQFLLLTLGSERVLFRIRKAFMQSLLRQDIGWVDAQRQGDVTSRLAE